MKLNKVQQRIVEENLALVGKVINDRVYGFNKYPNTTYEDLFQIGCIGLMKAAATDKGGNFSTYAYRLIWNELCDALIKTTKVSRYEISNDFDELVRYAEDEISSTLDQSEIRILIEQATATASGVTAKGIRCLQLSLEGYNSIELSKIYHTNPSTIRMWMSKARKYLRAQPGLRICAQEAALCA